MSPAAARARGILELTGLALFFYGFFAEARLALVFGGLLLVFDDLMAVVAGVLKPLFPVALAVVLAFVLTPWWVGVFWASAVFKVLDIPLALHCVLNPSAAIDRQAP